MRSLWAHFVIYLLFVIPLELLATSGKAAKKSRQLRQSQRDTEMKDFGDFPFEKDKMHNVDE